MSLAVLLKMVFWANKWWRYFSSSSALLFIAFWWLSMKKAGGVHSVSRWTRGVQVKLWDPLRTRVIPERIRGVFTTRRYTNPRLPLPSYPQASTTELFSLIDRLTDWRSHLLTCCPGSVQVCAKPSPISFHMPLRVTTTHCGLMLRCTSRSTLCRYDSASATYRVQTHASARRYIAC